jgi:hypothetical protein
VSKELNTLLTALYVLIDDHVAPSRTGRGRRPQLCDAEPITLAVAQVMLGYGSERRWVRYIRSSPQWRAMFPYLPNQSGYHKRLKKAQPLLRRAITAGGPAVPVWFDDMWMTDASAVPCGASLDTARRSGLAG